MKWFALGLDSASTPLPVTVIAPPGAADLDVCDALAASLCGGSEPTVLIGAGDDGGAALVAASTNHELRGLVLIDPVLVRRSLSASRPAQPTTLVPGLSAAVQIHVAGDAPGLLPEHVLDLEQRLRRRGVVVQVFLYGGERSMADAAPLAVARLWHRVRVFGAEIAGAGLRRERLPPDGPKG